MNTRRIASLLLFFVLLVPTIAFANEPDGCPQTGTGRVGPIPPYDYIANGGPYYDGCWTKSFTDYVIDYDSCSSFRNYWEFNYAATLTQSLVIPASHTGTTHLTFNYELDFDDPNHDGAWNRFTVYIRDTTPGAAVLLLGTNTYNGAYPSLYCSKRKIVIAPVDPTTRLPVDLAGHSITISFVGSRAYSNTHIRLKNVMLLRQ